MGSKNAGRGGNARIHLGKPTALKKYLRQAVKTVSEMAKKTMEENKKIDIVSKMVEEVTDEEINAGGEKIRQMMEKVYEITEGATLKVTGVEEMRSAAKRVKNAVRYIKDYCSDYLPMLNEDTVVINKDLTKESVNSLDRFQLTVAILTSRLRRKKEDKKKMYAHPRILRNEILEIKSDNEREMQNRRERDEKAREQKHLGSLTPNKRSTYDMAIKKQKNDLEEIKRAKK